MQNRRIKLFVCIVQCYICVLHNWHIAQSRHIFEDGVYGPSPHSWAPALHRTYKAMHQFRGLLYMEHFVGSGSMRVAVLQLS